MAFNEVVGDMWAIEADAYCITTNGFVKANGHAVMGAGCAKEASKLWPAFPSELGHSITVAGNVLQVFERPERFYVTFPVKHNWWEKADLQLIEESAKELMLTIQDFEWQKVLLPRPGCGNGKLLWADVSKVLEPILDRRVWIVSK